MVKQQLRWQNEGRPVMISLQDVWLFIIKCLLRINHDAVISRANKFFVDLFGRISTKKT